ncbi:hypothetical protein SCANM124S_01048 [Streptomyces canus]
MAATALLKPRSVTRNWIPKTTMSRCPERSRENIITEYVGTRNRARTDFTVTGFFTRTVSFKSASCSSAAPTPGSLKATATMSPARTQTPPIAHIP